MNRFVFLLTASLMISAAAFAQDMMENPEAVNARLEVKISQLEEQIRKLQGSLEESNFQNKQLKTQLDKANADMDFRVSALEKKTVTAVAPAVATPAAAPETTTVETSTGPAPATTTTTTTVVAPAPVAMESFKTPREHYNYAFKLLNQAKYVEAERYFDAFTKKYSKDPLIGNAFYWLGESFYVRKDYIKAADSFRQGYEAMPAGPKAADNLLKLAMALDALKKDKEACVVLKQVVAKFGQTSSSAKGRAEQEINRIGCN